MIGIITLPFFFFFSYFKLIFPALTIPLTFPLRNVTILVQPVHVVRTHIYQGKMKEDKTQIQNMYFSMKNKLLVVGENGFCISEKRFLHGTQESTEMRTLRKFYKKRLRKSSFQQKRIKYVPSQTGRGEILMDVTQWQSSSSQSGRSMTQEAEG